MMLTFILKYGVYNVRDVQLEGTLRDILENPSSHKNSEI
jgi:hypothetical protein